MRIADKVDQGLSRCKCSGGVEDGLRPVLCWVPPPLADRSGMPHRNGQTTTVTQLRPPPFSRRRVELRLDPPPRVHPHRSLTRAGSTPSVACDVCARSVYDADTIQYLHLLMCTGRLYTSTEGILPNTPNMPRLSIRDCATCHYISVCKINLVNIGVAISRD